MSTNVYKILEPFEELKINILMVKDKCYPHQRIKKGDYSVDPVQVLVSAFFLTFV